MSFIRARIAAVSFPKSKSPVSPFFISSFGIVPISRVRCGRSSRAGRSPPRIASSTSSNSPRLKFSRCLRLSFLWESALLHSAIRGRCHSS